MNTNFEPAMAALFASLQAVPGFLTTGRRLIPWSKVAAQPALFLRRIGTVDVGDDPFTITTVLCEIWIYSKAGEDPDAVPDAALSSLDQQVRAVFAPDTLDGRFTLGGLAYWCRIEGHSPYSPGDLSGQGLSQIPVKITLP